MKKKASKKKEPSRKVTKTKASKTKEPSKKVTKKKASKKKEPSRKVTKKKESKKKIPQKKEAMKKQPKKNLVTKIGPKRKDTRGWMACLLYFVMTFVLDWDLLGPLLSRFTEDKKGEKKMFARFMKEKKSGVLLCQ